MIRDLSVMSSFIADTIARPTNYLETRPTERKGGEAPKMKTAPHICRTVARIQFSLIDAMKSIRWCRGRDLNPHVLSDGGF
jgi:hypothetical protein